MDGTIVAVSSTSEPNSDQGCVYIYEYDVDTWSYTTTLTMTGGANGDQFGSSVGVSGEYVIAGAPFDDDAGSSSGSATIFFRNAGAWDTQVKITASDAASVDYFGAEVAISGDYAIVGAWGNSDAGSQSGSAYIFKRSGGSWSQQQKLVAADAAAGDTFGGSVDIDGDTAIVASKYSGVDAGKVYVYTRSGVTWTEQQQLTPSDAADYDEFGRKVQLWGDYAAITSFSGIYIFHRSGVTWTEEFKFVADGVTYDTVLRIAMTEGAEYATVTFQSLFDSLWQAIVYERTGAVWEAVQELTPENPGDFINWGTNLAMSGNTLVGGSANNEELVQEFGIAIFEKAP